MLVTDLDEEKKQLFFLKKIFLCSKAYLETTAAAADADADADSPVNWTLVPGYA